MPVPSFAFHDMGWHDFQKFCHTVLREVLGQQVTAFLDRNDGGRDGGFVGRWTPTHAATAEGEFVAQCKHTARVGHNLALSDLTDEFDKAERLVGAGRCDVYVLMSNAGLSGRTEEDIVNALKQRGVRQVLVLGSTWLNQTVAESSRLRRMVPRLYGLGDLTQILDERAYRQARAVLDSMRADLSKMVLTGTYALADDALARHRFVLLIGAPAAGKTTIAAQLALASVDTHDAAIAKLDTIADLQDRWNPDENQLFWLDDAFGTTQFDRSLARSWTLAISRLAGAVDAGALFVVTSRDYIFQAARPHLKPGSFPLLNEAQVVVDVADLTAEERRQILYNHLRLGRQPVKFIAAAHPHLEELSDHAGFTPELARRLGDPMFTSDVEPASASSLLEFFHKPNAFLRDVMMGLDVHSRAALGLIFINRNWLPSPVVPNDTAKDFMQRLGSDLGGVTQGLESLAGGLVRNIVQEGETGWTFAHPTMVDAYADLLRTPELLHHLITGFPLEVLLSEVTCGSVGIEGAVVVPQVHYQAVLDRLDEPIQSDDYTVRWRSESRRSSFLATRCDSAFLRQWLERHPEKLSELDEPGLMLEAVAQNELVARLNHFGLLEEPARARFASWLVSYCVSGIDPAVLWNETLGSVLTAEEQRELRNRVRIELLADLPAAIETCTAGWDPEQDSNPESAVEPLRTLAYHLPKVYPDDPEIQATSQMLDQLLDEWVNSHWRDGDDDGDSSDRYPTKRLDDLFAITERSVFDDLLDGRSMN